MVISIPSRVSSHGVCKKIIIIEPVHEISNNVVCHNVRPAKPQISLCIRPV